jgi:hypothetical protein
MSKYDPLGSFLKSRSTEEVPMKFEEVEAVIGTPLPPAAARHPAWWSNNPRNNVMTRVWLEAGYRTERVDLGGRKLVFRRAAKPAPTQDPSPTAPTTPRGGRLEALRSRLRGTVRFAPGFDPTEPTGEIWDAET